MEGRKETLLKAALEMLRKVQDQTTETVYYDEAECDIYCLIDDIEAEL
jgi:hypothetical protein